MADKTPDTNTNNSADMQGFFATDSPDMRDEFQKWLTDGNAKKYSVSEIIYCMDRISEYAIHKNISKSDIWKNWLSPSLRKPRHP